MALQRAVLAGLLIGAVSAPALAGEEAVADSTAEAAPVLPYLRADGLDLRFQNPYAGAPLDVDEAAAPPLDYADSSTEVCFRNQEEERECVTRTKYRGGGYRTVPRYRYPWQAQIYVLDGVSSDWRDEHWCGGSLIAPGWVLTAAHCTRDSIEAMGAVRVRLGAFDLSVDDARSYRIDRVVLHANYVRHEKPHDIALLHIVPDRIQPRRLFPALVKPVPLEPAWQKGQDPLKVEELVETTGWGRTTYKGELRQVLGVGRLRLVSMASCRKIYGETINSNVLCAYAPGVDACQGDSGGPLIQPLGPRLARQIGIVSFGRGCVRKDIPGVYTRVSAYRAWIDEAIRQRGAYTRLPDPRTPGTATAR